MLLLWVLTVLNSVIVRALSIQFLECDPPDFPRFGGYGPKQDSYTPGDVIHYYCNVDTYISGNFYRICEDTGDWSGDTPFCDVPASFAFVNQSTTATPEDENDANNAVDDYKSSCSSTASGEAEIWLGIFEVPGELTRVMLFLPKMEVAYEVLMLKSNGEELSCGIKRGNIDQLGWEFHICPRPYNKGVTGIKIKSLSSAPLQICEIAAHVIKTPACSDPHVLIINGRLHLTRYKALLICDRGYIRSPDFSLECVRNGVWNRKPVYCTEREFETLGPEFGTMRPEATSESGNQSQRIP